MNNLSITKKLIIGFSMMLLMILIGSAAAIVGLKVVSDQTDELYDHPFTVTNAVRDININVLSMSRVTRSALITPSEDNIRKAMIHLAETDKAVNIEFAILYKSFLGNKEAIKAAENSYKKWKAFSDEELILLQQGRKTEAENNLRKYGNQYVDDMQGKINVLLDFAGNKASEFMDTSNKLTARTILFLIILSIITITLGITISAYFGMSISRSVSGILPLADDIAAGITVLPQKNERKDEIGQIIDAFNRIIESNKSILSQTNAIAQGDYTVTVQPRSKDDELSLSLARMTETLRVTTEKNKQDSWLKTGQAVISNITRGDQDIATLCERIISGLALHLGASIGALFLWSDNDTLKLTASYAYTRRKNFSPNVPIGEGLVGQAAKEKKPILIKNIPADYIYIESGVGGSVPHSILVYPIVFNNTLKGVVELGSFKEYSSLDMEFLSMVTESIAIAIESNESRQHIESLLEVTQKQSEELQQQQEELRQANEELEQQQEELRQTNEELQEQARLLEEQKQSVDAKNNDLLKARSLLEERARDLETTGKYKSEFLANMSHELRTPLNSILLLSKLLAENKTSSMTDKQVDYAKTINSSGNGLLELINEILDLSKVEAGKMEVHPEKILLQDIVSKMKDTFGTVAEQKGIALNFNLDNHLPQTMITDKLRQEQILKNLISNAVKFTEKGSVSVNIIRAAAETTFRRIDIKPEECIAFVVSDTGVGIPADKQKVIFEAFQQADGSTNRRFGGTGLGLSISRELAKLLGGEIHLVSTAGQGSIFTLFLPVIYKQEVAATETDKIEKNIRPAETLNQSSVINIPDDNKEFVPDDRRNIAQGDKVLLIIEDDQNFAGTLCDLAHERDFKVLVAGSGESGLHFADYYKPQAIILDIGLPGIDGWEVMSRLKDNPDTRHIPVHFMSANDFTIDAMKMGAVGFFTKPISLSMIDEAFEKIKELLSRKIKHLLIIEDYPAQRKAIRELIGNGDVKTSEAATGAEALLMLHKHKFDCIVLDLGLPDMPGIELLAKIKDDDEISAIPVIVYTGKELTQKEKSIINQYAEKIIIKGAKDAEKLLDETALFLHRVEKNLPQEKQRLIRMTHDKEKVLSGKKILITDDDMRNVYALSSVLEEKDIKIITARDGKECLKRLEENKDIDLVLMDIMMPVMDGYETMQAIRNDRRYKELPIIALTAKAMKGDRDKCVEAGASDYLAKPVDAEKLLSILRVWLYRGN